MEIVNVYIKDNGRAQIKCPACKTVREIDAAAYREQKKILKIKCSCREVFGVSLESRKSFRKETHLHGKCVNLSRKNIRDDIIVKDVSMSGVGFIVISGRHAIRDGDEITVEFRLDDAQNSLVTRNAVVRLVNDSFIGCEFSDHLQYNKALGFYLMPS